MNTHRSARAAFLLSLPVIIHVVLTSVTVLIIGCRSPDPEPVPNPAVEIERVFREDMAAHPTASQAGSGRSSADAIKRYASALRAIPFRNVPQDFHYAYMEHIHAWEAMAVAVERKPQNDDGHLLIALLGLAFGQPHLALPALIDGAQTSARGAREADREKVEASDQIRQTWNRIELLAIRYGAELPRQSSSPNRAQSGTAEISGKVTLKGTLKPEVPIQLDATCGRLHGKTITTHHYVVGRDNGLANVFVYVKSGAEPTPPKAEAPLLNQVNCMYEPYVFGVVAGQKFKVRNSDPLLHNVHPTPKNNRELNLAQVVKDQVNEIKFDNPEVLVRIKCDVHPWMFAYVGVQDHPYFAVTDNDGNFRISNLPNGKYTIEAYHLKAGAKTEDIHVTGSQRNLNFELEAAP